MVCHLFCTYGNVQSYLANADTMLAKEAINNNIPICSSMAASTSLEKMYELSNGLAWFQLYIGQDEDFVVDLLNRAQDCGYKTIILTVDTNPCKKIKRQ